MTSKGSLHKRIQVIISPNGKKDVFYDDEVICMASVKLKEGISKKEGEDVYSNELVRGKENIIIVDSFVPGKENCLHITCRKTFCLFNFGLRVGEMATLSLQDISFKDKVILIREHKKTKNQDEL